jgi:hypothetical protein
MEIIHFIGLATQFFRYENYQKKKNGYILKALTTL